MVRNTLSALPQTFRGPAIRAAKCIKVHCDEDLVREYVAEAPLLTIRRTYTLRTLGLLHASRRRRRAA